MKIYLAILALLLALVVAGCGESGGTTTVAKTDPRGDPRFPIPADQGDPHFAVVSGGSGRRAQPQIDPPDLPPPKRLLVRDLEVGTGPMAQRGDELAIWYIGVSYRTGKEVFFRWPPLSAPLVFRLGSGGNGDAFEAGVEGMRAGGRREILIPARLMGGDGAIDYVVELLRIEPPSKAPGRG